MFQYIYKKLKTCLVQISGRVGSYTQVCSSRCRWLYLHHQAWCLLFFASSIAVLVYGHIVWNGYFFSDDFTWAWHSQQIHGSWSSIVSARMSTFYSPVVNALYAFLYPKFGYYEPIIFFGVSLCLHIMVSFFSGVLVWQLGRKMLAASVTTVVVAFGGVAYEPVLWIAANMHTLVTLFILLCVICFYRYVDTKKNVYIFISLLFFVLALGTKESAIVTPALLAMTWVFHGERDIKRMPVVLFAISVIMVSIIYMIHQYMWQKDSVWIQQQIWNLDVFALLRAPTIVLHHFIPLTYFKKIVIHIWPVVSLYLWVFALCACLLTTYMFRTSKLYLYGLGWMLITMSPFIFFKTDVWWDVLPSRYGYLLQIGAACICAGVIQYWVDQHIKFTFSKVKIFTMTIVIFVCLYASNQHLKRTYEGYYSVGRSLHHAMEQILYIQPDWVFVRAGRPFEKNIAHIVGAAHTIAHVPEDRIVFLKDSNKTDMYTGSIVVLYWNMDKRQYVVQPHMQ